MESFFMLFAKNIQFLRCMEPKPFATFQGPFATYGDHMWWVAKGLDNAALQQWETCFHICWIYDNNSIQKSFPIRFPIHIFTSNSRPRIKEKVYICLKFTVRFWIAKKSISF